MEKTHATVMQDRRITTRLLAECLGVDKRPGKFWGRDMQRRKICSRFAPHSLTAEQRELKFVAVSLVC
jgi:hypothetical protein